MVPFRVSLTFDLLRSCSPFIQFRRFKSCAKFTCSFLGHTWSKTRRMACLTSQQSELSRSDIASSRLLRDHLVSNFEIREDVFGKKENQSGWALTVFQLSGRRWIGDVSKLNTTS